MVSPRSLEMSFNSKSQATAYGNLPDVLQHTDAKKSNEGCRFLGRRARASCACRHRLPVVVSPLRHRRELDHAARWLRVPRFCLYLFFHEPWTTFGKTFLHSVGPLSLKGFPEIDFWTDWHPFKQFCAMNAPGYVKRFVMFLEMFAFCKCCGPIRRFLMNFDRNNIGIRNSTKIYHFILNSGTNWIFELVQEKMYGCY